MKNLKSITSRRGSLCFVAVIAALQAACGGGGESGGTLGAPSASATTVRLSGVAATGAAIANATVTAVNARGERSTALTTVAGAYQLDINEAAPYLLSVADSTGKTWYSYAQAAGAANITPLTTLALLQANASKPLADLAAAWSTRQLSATQVIDAAKVVNANLAAVMQGKGVAATTTNIFTQTFSANGTGLDAVLDALRLSINCTSTGCTQNLTTPSGSSLVSWNSNIATSGFSFNWASGGSTGSIDIGLGSCRAPKSGTYSLVVQTTVSGLGVAPIPEVCIDGLTGKPTAQADFCGSRTVAQQLPAGVQVLSCSFDGTTGTVTARIGQPLLIDYSVKYTFVLRP